MAEYKEVIKQFIRMCDAQEICQKCPVNETRGLLTCWRALADKPDKMEEIVMQWVEEHPLITNRDKFREVFGIDISDLFALGISRHLQNWLEKEYKEPKDE